MHPCTGTEALYRPYGPQGRVDIQLYTFLTTAREGGERSGSRPRPLFTSGKDPVPIVQEAAQAPGPVWTGAENLAPHRDSIPEPSSPQPVAIPTTLPGPRCSITFWGFFSRINYSNLRQRDRSFSESTDLTYIAACRSYYTIGWLQPVLLVCQTQLHGAALVLYLGGTR